jgi:hypothetical protein
MKKFCAILLVSCVFSGQSFANGGIGGGIEFVSPVGDFEEIAGGGYGFFGDIYVPLNHNMLLNFHAGFLAYGGLKWSDGSEIAWGGIPLTIGGVFYPSGVEEGGLYLKGSGGVLFKVGVATDSYGREETVDRTNSVISAGVGISGGPLDFSADYNISPADGDGVDFEWIGIKVGILLR